MILRLSETKQYFKTMCRSGFSNDFTKLQNMITRFCKRPDSHCDYYGQTHRGAVLFHTGGKPSTWLPPGGLVEQSDGRRHHNVGHQPAPKREEKTANERQERRGSAKQTKKKHKARGREEDKKREGKEKKS